MTRRRGPLFAVLAALSAACAGEDAAPAALRIEAAALPIVDGTATNGEPGVVPLLVSGHIFCTGTVVTQFSVVTAAHCLAPRPDAIALADGSVVPVSAVLPHPDFDHRTLANDVAVLVLAKPVDPALGTPLIREPLEKLVGESITITGYGKAALDDTVPKKRTGTARIASVEPTRLVVEPGPAAPCVGDSGGPAFVTRGGREVLAGVVSSGDESCTGASHFTRVDAFGPWLTEQLASAEPHTHATGDRCLHLESCAEGPCFSPPDAPSFPYCTRPCANDDACPSGMHCDAAQCVYARSPGAIGARCDSDNQCETAQCASADGMLPVCSKLCVEEFTSCAVGRCKRDDRHPGFSACLAEMDPAPEASCAMRARSRSSEAAAPGALALAGLVGMGIVARRRQRVTFRARSVP